VATLVSDQDPAPGDLPSSPRIPPLAFDRLLLDWRGARDRTESYARALGLDPHEGALLVRRAIEQAVTGGGRRTTRGARGDALDALAEMLVEEAGAGPAEAAPSGDAFEGWRLAAWWAGAGRPAAPAQAPPPRRFASAPPLSRRPMPPARLRRAERARETSTQRARRRMPWARAGRRRRVALGFLVLIPSVIATGFMIEVLPYQGRTPLEFLIALLFGALFGWISIGFWTALAGFALLLRGGDRYLITRTDSTGRGPIDPASRTAIVMPVCEEPVERVYTGLEVIHGELERHGALEHFDFFVLSDSIDPSTLVEEELGWAEWRRRAQRVFYRRRKVRRKRKSGNVADFCRRWGVRYRYMIVLDSDSLMSAETILRLVRLMERNPDVGAIQTVPVVFRARSLFARAQRFASRLYGPMFAAGLHYWHLGESPYWGHNAILRVEPFMRHCGLPRLPGRPPFGGDIMSHDFVEAALLGRAGWSLWLAWDLAGSYEEAPATLLEEMQRDRRWCQGNLQHLRLLFTRGRFGAHRALFLNGVLAYGSALLWLCFLGASTAEAILHAIREPDYFPSGASLFPQWPIWRPDWVLSLLATTVLILFLPKLLGMALVLFRSRDARAYGGAGALAASVLSELLLSALLAPIRMVFYCRFVLLALLGRAVGWRLGGAEGAETGWGEAARRHGGDTVVATSWALAVFSLNPDYFWWLTPVAVALVLSVPLSVLTSRTTLGDAARRRGLFAVPEERDAPLEVAELETRLEKPQGAPRWADGFVRAVVDPYANAIHCALLRGPRSLLPRIAAARDELLARALAKGPASLAAAERRILLGDPSRMREAHRAVWQLEDAEAARRWGL
jgi:membrane glycosyltransferase